MRQSGGQARGGAAWWPRCRHIGIYAPRPRAPVEVVDVVDTGEPIAQPAGADEDVDALGEVTGRAQGDGHGLRGGDAVGRGLQVRALEGEEPGLRVVVQLHAAANGVRETPQ